MESNELQKHTEEIIDNYINNKKSITQMSKEYGCKRHQIYYILDKNHIARRSNSESHRKYTINENYFDVIDTPEKAYILGFFFADGSNNNIINSIVLSLKDNDYEILEQIRDVCGSNKPLYYYTYIHHDDGVARNEAILTLCSKHMCQKLSEKGMVPNKTFILDFPVGVPDELMSHFYRGYLDGDGCIHHYSNPMYKNRNSVQLTSSKKFCMQSKKYLNKKLNIGFYMTHSKHHTDKIWTIKISSRRDVKIFLDWIYKDATIKLERKYEIYKKYILE